MLSVQVRTSHTSHGFIAIAPWVIPSGAYTYGQINLGSNPIGSLEIVSALNSFNLARAIYHYNYTQYTKKYNPKVYLSAVQTTSPTWISDIQNGQENGLGDLPGGGQKSGSWPLVCVSME